MAQVNFKSFDISQRKFFKRNYGDALEHIIPSIYTLEDFTLSGIELDPLDLLLESHLNAAKNIGTILPISATLNFSAINTLSGIYPFFVKQNALTRVTPFLFERDILDPLGFQMEAFDTSSEWKAYLQNYLAPALTLNSPSATISTPSGDVTTSDAYGFSGSSLHEYLINSLGWFYLLNTSSISGGVFDPSTYVIDQLSELFLGKELYTLEGVQGFQQYLWKNYPHVTALQRARTVPDNYLSGTTLYTSSTQGLDRLETLIEVLYSPLYADNKDFRVRDVFEDYMTLDSFTPAEVGKGPFHKLLRVLGYFYQDTNSPAEELQALNDIETCPAKYLPHLADLIGWEFIGSDPDRWRSQLRNAVRIYKAKGTAFSTQLVLDTLFGQNNDFNLSSSMHELHESYIPFMVYYLLATACPYFNQSGYKDDPFSLWTQTLASQNGVVDAAGKLDYSTSSMDSNIRRCVDKILRTLWTAHPNNFLMGSGSWPAPGTDPNFIFTYRDRDYEIPPFERHRYYEKVFISEPLLNTLWAELNTFQISPTVTTSALDYIRNYSISSTDNISIGNKFILYTSGYNTPFNFTEILNDISNKKASYLSLWSSKSSHFNLNLSASDYKFSTKSESSTTTLGITKAIQALNKTIPAHAIPIVKLFLEIIDDVSNFLYACPTPMYQLRDFFTSSTVMNAWEASGVDMTAYDSLLGIGHGLSSTSNSRTLVDSLSDILMNGSNGDITKGAVVPRNNLRRRNLYQTFPRNRFFDRTGFNMPNSYSPSTFDQYTGASGGGALTLGYNYSACEFQTPFPVSVSALHPVWHECETSTSPNSYFHIDSSNTFPWRGAKSIVHTLGLGKCLEYVRREELPEIVRVMHRTLEKDAYKNAFEAFKDVSNVWAPSSSWTDPVQCLANSAFNGVSAWDTYADYTFGSSINEVYNRYAREFGRHGTAPYLVSGEEAHGGKNIFSHIYGPLLYNGNFLKDGSAVSLVASAFDIADYSGVTEATLHDAGGGSIAYQNTGKLVVGQGSEFRYPFAFSGVEFCMKVASNLDPANRPSFQCYRADIDYGIQNPQIETSLIQNGLLQVSAATTNGFFIPRIRFSLHDYGSTTTSANLLLPEHNFSFSMNMSRYAGPNVADIWVWIHTMPEDGYFWSWVPRKDWNYSNKHRNGEWVASLVTDVDGVNPFSTAMAYVKSQSTNFKIPKEELITSIDQLSLDDFTNYSIDFNTSNKLYRDSGKFLPHPKPYTPPFLHRNDQKYVVEVFCNPITGTTPLHYVFSDITMIDKTLSQTALDEFRVYYMDNYGTFHDKTITRTDLDDYRVYFKYMNSLAASSLGAGLATRIAADSSGIFEASGGSRLNYRYHPKWGTYELDHAGFKSYKVVDFSEGKETT